MSNPTNPKYVNLSNESYKVYEFIKEFRKTKLIYDSVWKVKVDLLKLHNLSI